MIKILGISGSLRTQSHNTALLRAAQALAGSGIELEIATLHGIPLYDGDLEQEQGIPPAVSDLKTRVIASDGLLLATPEYNHGIPGVLKNAIDWLSRPPGDIPTVFGGKPVAIAGASIGNFGTILAQNAWLPVLKILGARHWSGGRLLISRADHVFDANGTLQDDGVRKQMEAFLRGFAGFI